MKKILLVLAAPALISLPALAETKNRFMTPLSGHQMGNSQFQLMQAFDQEQTKKAIM